MAAPDPVTRVDDYEVLVIDGAEIAEEMMMLSHDHDGFTAGDCAEIRNTDFGLRLGLKPAA